MCKIVSLIPARSGSKGVPLKNIKELDGQPLIGYTVVDSLRSRHIENTYVSTNSTVIAEIAKKYGADVPFIRPEKYATDTSLDMDYIRHFMAWHRVILDELPEWIVHLRPTTPLRDPLIIDKAIEYLAEHPEATALRSVHKVSETPFKMFYKEGEYLNSIYPHDGDMVKEFYNLPRQSFPQVYCPNGYVDILKTSTLLKNSLHGDKILAFETPFTPEIDTQDDWDYLEWKQEKLENAMSG